MEFFDKDLSRKIWNRAYSSSMMVGMAGMAGLLLIFLMVLPLSADIIYDKVTAQYPRERYIVGIGEADKSDDQIKDKRMTEILARLEIAKQIKVRVREETVDIMCSGGTSKLFVDSRECRDEFIMVVEETVDEFLEGAKIVDFKEEEGRVYSVAVLPRDRAGEDLERHVEESLKKTRENLDKAKQGKKGSLGKAQEEYLKALTYHKEKEVIQGVRGRASKIFEELEQELLMLSENP